MGAGVSDFFYYESKLKIKKIFFFRRGGARVSDFLKKIRVGVVGGGGLE